MNILYCGDSNIERGLVLSLLSIVRRYSQPLHVYVMTMRLHTPEKEYTAVSDECISLAEQVLHSVNSQSSIRKINAREAFLNELPLANLDTRFTPYCMLRLYADIFEEIPDKILYLDNDVICRKDFSDFYYQNIDDCEFIGVLDHYGSWFFRRNPFRRDYVNSGVLLLNMRRIRESGLFEKCRARCCNKKMFMPDQSALNKLSTAKRFAVRHLNEQRRLHDDTVFQHFTTHFNFFPVFKTVTVKPWQFDRVHEVLHLHEYDDLFEEYKAIQAKIQKEQ